MNTKWMLGTGLLALSNVALAAGWQDSQKITEYFIDGADIGERLLVGFEFAPNPDGCNGDPGLARVNRATAKGKSLFSRLRPSRRECFSRGPRQRCISLDLVSADIRRERKKAAHPRDRLDRFDQRSR